MLSGMSSTANAIYNMTTNAAMPSSILQLADANDDSHLLRNAALGLILLFGISTYLYRYTPLKEVLQKSLGTAASAAELVKDTEKTTLLSTKHETYDTNQLLQQSIHQILRPDEIAINMAIGNETERTKPAVEMTHVKIDVSAFHLPPAKPKATNTTPLIRPHRG